MSMVLSYALFKKRITRQAFTLVELLVSIGIMAMVLGIAVSGAPQAIMRLSLSDNTYQSEIMLREAQLQGSAINSLNNTYGGAGIFFDLATSSKILKFKDKVDSSISHPIGIGNGIYDAGSENTDETIFSLINNHRIGKLCVGTSTAQLYCNSNIKYPVNTLTVSFSRPKQMAHIYRNGTSTEDFNIACIQFDSIRSPEKGYVRALFVYKSGMIVKRVGTCQ